MMTRTFWLSFCDSDRPTGQQFLGVAVVDVTDEDVAESRVEVARLFPHAKEGAEWIAAASRKAWRLGCNPGGEMAFKEMPHEWPAFDTFPRHRLIQKAELATLDS